MKKSKKITIGVICGLITAAIAGTLLGVFIPPLLNKQKIEDLVKNQVKPEEGKGNFLKYDTYPNLSVQDFANLSYADKIQSIQDFSKESLKKSGGYETILKNLISNYTVLFWKNYKDSAAYTERFEKWEKEINEEWDNEVKNYKNSYGSNWEYYFQSKVLDPVGGNESDWKRSKIVQKANSSFDDYVFENVYINGLRKDNSDVLAPLTGNISVQMQEYLTSPEFVNGTNGSGTRNKIVFQPSNSEKKLNPVSEAIAKFQEFIFMEYVKSELPLMTSMTLWKHVDPLTSMVNGYSFFNTKKADQIYNGNYSTREGEGDSGSGDSSQSTTGISTSYKWQAFPSKTLVEDSPNGSLNKNTTDKYLDFVSSYNTKNKFIDANTGAINIPVTYTDDSATLYFIKLSGGDKSVFSTSYTQYAAGATYKFNQILGVNDQNVPTTNSLSVTPIIANTSGTEIMSNFMKKSAATNGFINLPEQVKQIINDDNTYYFKGLYNGVQSVADTVDVSSTPYILTRNESGVHIIGIDRFDKIKEATTYEGKINEIANTLLWRHFLTQNKLNDSGYLNNGLTNFDLRSEIKDFFTKNRNKILYKYILENENNQSIDQNLYLFGNNRFTNVSTLPKLSSNPFNEYIKAWFNHDEYSSHLTHRQLVKSKILEIQKSGGLTNKTFGNSVIQNGIASIQPYTRNTTKNVNITRGNAGYVDQTYGSYDSLELFENLDSSQKYTEVGLKAKLDDIENKVNVVYNSLSNYNGIPSEIGFKKLTYSSAGYNQYLQIGYPNVDSMIKNGYMDSDNYYTSNIELLNQSVANLISGEGAYLKNRIEIQRSLADIQFDPAVDKPAPKPEEKPKRAITSKTNILDIQNIALEGTYSSPTSMVANVPQIPSQIGANNKQYVNYFLQKSFDTLQKLPNITSDLSQYSNFTIDQLYELSRNTWATPLFKDQYEQSLLSYLKDIMGIKYAFDFNDETGSYDFTKFKNYLIDQTSNYKKAAFVWVNEERNDLINNFETMTIEQRFSPKEYPIMSGIDVNGYIYQGANGIDTYKENNLFKQSTTFNDNTSYWLRAPIKDGQQEYHGFQGMVFESNVSSFPELSGSSSQLFSNDLYVFDKYNGVPTKDNLVSKGSMFNIGSRQNLAKEVENGIFTWDAVIRTSTWLNSTFDINVDNVSQTDLAKAKSDLKNIVLTETTKIPDSLFERNDGSLLASSTSIFEEKLPMYFGDDTIKGSSLSQVIFTQFNYFDVVNLFDTNGDKELTDDDKGINWAYASSNGFLGVSAEAFFISAMKWYISQPSYSTTAYKNSQKRQGKFETFDRRLNDLFGEALISNWKENL